MDKKLLFKLLAKAPKFLAYILVIGVFGLLHILVYVSFKNPELLKKGDGFSIGGAIALCLIFWGWTLFQLGQYSQRRLNEIEETEKDAKKQS